MTVSIGAVADLGKVVRLPVIPGAGRKQPVERLLPVNIRLNADELAVWRAECLKRFDQLFALSRVANIEDSEDNDLFSMNFFRKKRKRRSFPQDRPHVQLIGSGLDEFAIFGEYIFGLLKRKYDQTG